jgi:Secretion system C-terminal sorting domain
MKNTYLLVILLVLKTSFLSAQVAPSNEGVTINKYGISTIYYGSGGTPIYNGANFGSLLSGSIITMSLPFMNISSICPAQSATFSYRIYASTAPAPAGTVVNLTNASSTLWNNTTVNINILSGLSIGNYKIDIKYDYKVQPSSNVICAGYTSGWISAGFSVAGPTGPSGPSGPSTTLAVEMATLTARKQSNKEIAILWKTEQEQANKSFIIERSSDGLSFSNIGSLQGAENSTIEKTYNFTDAAPLQGVNYYRIKSVDVQGKETTSKTVSVNFSDKMNNKLQIYPNPARSDLQIEMILDEEATKPIQIFDLAGRIILSQNAVLTKGLNNIALDVNTLSSGTYLVKMGSEMSRFIKM